MPPDGFPAFVAGLRRLTAEHRAGDRLRRTVFPALPAALDAGQLRQAYPAIGRFFAARRRYDPDERLTNTFYNTYAPATRPER